MDRMQKYTPKWTNCNVFPLFTIVCFWKCKFSLLTSLSQLNALPFFPLWPLCRSPGPNSAYNEVPRCNWEHSLARQSKCLRTGTRAGDEPGGLPWALSPTLRAWWPGQPLGFGLSGAGPWKLPALALLQKWTGENGRFAKGNNPQVDQKSLKNQLIAAEKLLKVCEWWLDLSFKWKSFS